jgi:3-phosphoshikimate 1-carboxyvinyltransferase
LLAGLFADSPTTVREPSESRDHTERILRACGVDLQITNCELRINPSANLTIPNSQFTIPSDFSSAAFFIVAALLVPNSEICIPNVGLNPTRTGLLDALTRMGASISAENQHEESGEPVGDLVIGSASDLRGTIVSGSEIPRMIDEFPIFAIAATQARGETMVRDAVELRVKESDRVATVAQELRKMGAKIEERADGFVIEGPTKLQGARVSAHNDHRLAMSLAVAALIAQGDTVIEGWECVADSFPGFEQVLLTTKNTKGTK